MAETKISSQLNDLLIQIGRSFLQYVDESWPWVSTAEQESRQTLEDLAANQRESVGALARLLNEYGHFIDFGTYPTVYTSLHYVDVEFLLDQLEQNQAMIVKVCESTATTVQSDSVSANLLRDIAIAEQRRLDELRKLAAK
ncbi:MAG: hypothetical protein KDA93_07840 [Planctomycetaceae bacterium]|nr:hypothetical protein [Planctomycetaceae bacterium]